MRLQPVLPLASSPAENIIPYNLGAANSIGGGYKNTISSAYGSIAGGSTNLSSGVYGSIGGGFNNKAAGEFGSVSGGESNQRLRAQYASVPGGQANSALGQGSFAAWHGIERLKDNGDFVWSDDPSGGGVTPIAVTGNNQFLARARGGVTFYTSANLASGVSLAPGLGNVVEFERPEREERHRAGERRRHLGARRDVANQRVQLHDRTRRTSRRPGWRKISSRRSTSAKITGTSRYH